jgi:hypothetical protein
MVNFDLMFIALQIELYFIIIMLFYIVYLLAQHKSKKPDSLFKYIKEYLVEGYTLHQVREKLIKLGFEKERIDKIMAEFLQRH